MRNKIIYIRQKDIHPAFKTLYRNPPKNLNLLFKNQEILKNNRNKNNDKKISFINFFSFKLQRIYEHFFRLLKLPPITPIISFKNLYYDYILSYNLILSHRKIIYNLEYIGSLVNFRDNILKSRISIILIRRLLLSKKCKYVFTWSKSAKYMLFDFLKIPKDKQYKFKYLYPSIKPINYIKSKNSKKITLLFISSIYKKDREFNFFMKGGKLVLQAYKQLKSQYDQIELYFIGYIPKDYSIRYKELLDLHYYIKLPYEEILELYKKTDIFLFPSYGDTFGFTYLEAMAHGLPIICLDNNSAAPELVINNETGFVVKTSQKFLAFPLSKYNPEWISELKFYSNLKYQNDSIGLNNFIQKLEQLITNIELREYLGKNGKKRLINGDLSIEFRNKLLYSFFNY